MAERGAADHAGVPGHHHGGNLGEPRHVDDAAAFQDHDDRFAGRLGDGVGDQLVLHARVVAGVVRLAVEGEVRAIAAAVVFLALVIRGQAGHDDHDVLARGIRGAVTARDSCRAGRVLDALTGALPLGCVEAHAARAHVADADAVGEIDGAAVHVVGLVVDAVADGVARGIDRRPVVELGAEHRDLGRRTGDGQGAVVLEQNHRLLGGFLRQGGLGVRDRSATKRGRSGLQPGALVGIEAKLLL